jgi:phosphoglycolate phosphatase-like HAD superfamily hydrolase
MKSKKIIALDGDGVLLDFHSAYRLAWERAFGVLPDIVDHQAYWAMDRYDVRRLEGEERKRFADCFDHVHWSSLPALPGAVDACHRLNDAGYELVCVTAIPAEFEDARMANLRQAGFPIERIIATPMSVYGDSPKVVALTELKPLAFVDDYLPFFAGIPSEVHAALILREPNGSPNVGPELENIDSQHQDLPAFADWWLDNR